MTAALAPARKRRERPDADRVPADHRAARDQAADRLSCGLSPVGASDAADRCRDIRPELIIELI
jgi:hypothetical protein